MVHQHEMECADFGLIEILSTHCDAKVSFRHFGVPLGTLCFHRALINLYSAKLAMTP